MALGMHSVNTDSWLAMKALIIAERLGLPTAAYKWGAEERLRAVVGAQVSEMTAEQMEVWLGRFDEDRRETRLRREPYFNVRMAPAPRNLNAEPTKYGTACPRCGWRNIYRDCGRCRGR